MAEYRRGGHTVFDIHLHLVWITKYRRPALQGEVATRVRDLIRDICGQHDVAILKGHVSKDHVHLLVIDPTADNDQPFDAVAERPHGTSPAGGISPFEEAVLGKAPMGERLLLLQLGQCHGRDHRPVHRESEHDAG